MSRYLYVHVCWCQAFELTSLVVQELQFDQNIGSQFDKPYLGRMSAAKEHAILIVASQNSAQWLRKGLGHTHTQKAALSI